MSLTATQICLTLVVIVTLALLGVFIFAIPPETLTLVGQWSFFGLWFLLAQNTSTLGLLLLAKRLLGETRAVAYRGAAFRQGMLLALLVTGITVAQYFQLLTWWGVLLMLTFLLLIELTYRRFQTLKV